MKSEKVPDHDVDVQFRIRSSTEDLATLERITSLILETLSHEYNVGLVERNTNVTRTAEKRLITITSTLQSQ